MNSKYKTSEKQTIVARYKLGESVSLIAAETGIPRSTIYAWIKQPIEANSAKREISAKSYRLLENKVTRLEGIIEIMKKVGCNASDPLEVKLPALEALQGQYSVHMLCEALDVPRGTFYNFIFRNKRTNTWYAIRREELRGEIQKIYDDNRQIFGASKIRAVMNEHGYRVSKKLILELMHEMGIGSIRQDAKDIYEYAGRDGASRPRPWCMKTGEMVHGRRAHGA